MDKQVLYRRWKSSNINGKQSFPLILFLDVVSRSVSVLFIHASLYIYYPLVSGYCHGIWCRPVWTILSKGLPSIPFSACLPSPLFSHSPTLHPPPPFLVLVMLSLSLRGHTVTLFTGIHAGVRYVGLHAWMQVFVCVCLPLFLFSQISLTTILTKFKSARALACTHMHTQTCDQLILLDPT